MGATHFGMYLGYPQACQREILQGFLIFFYVRVTVHRNKFLCNKTN